jgi:ribosome-binding protein aMBF1 (putative translation factor)
MSWAATVADRPRHVYWNVIDRKAGTRKAGRMPAAPTFQLALGAAVKASREELGLTQEQLALKGDLHTRWVSNIENAWRNPSYGSLRRLAASLDLTTSQLIARAELAEGKVRAKKKPAAKH